MLSWCPAKQKSEDRVSAQKVSEISRLNDASERITENRVREFYLPVS